MLGTDSRADVDAYAEGRYVTDGVNLYRLLDDADEDQAMIPIEDCRSLAIVIVPAADMRERMRPVERRALTLASTP